MFGIRNYSEIRKEESGKRYLFDSTEAETQLQRLERYAARLKEPLQILQQHDYPVTELWQRAIAENGVEGLEKVVVAEADRQAQRLGVPRYVSAQWQKQAVADIPKPMRDEVAGLFRDLNSERSGLPIDENSALGFQDGTLVLKDIEEAVKKKIIDANSLEISDQMQGEANRLRELITQLRELDCTGVNVRQLVPELLGSRYTPSKNPALDDLRLLNRIRMSRELTAAELKEKNPSYFAQIGGEA